MNVQSKPHEAGARNDVGTTNVNAAEVETLAAGDFEVEVLQSDVPVLVDFWAPWCAPCRALAPAVEGAAEALAGSVRVAKLNADDGPDVMARYGIQAIPTLILFRDGEPIWRHIGVLGKDELVQSVREVVG